ncbi:uncharacterized protein LOC125178363 isoform X2 [Hyalella azteca]|uniref:Uncharacterized protein LOC125178363 isoform X2 n=1 Tax=Hyalella azteca TaxID=294128 RepID=A0A979FNV7_HYAAZ|nr:uncharacterized protein LOC125178363 isoform X2 [Hyalella azteca]
MKIACLVVLFCATATRGTREQIAAHQNESFRPDEATGADLEQAHNLNVDEAREIHNVDDENLEKWTIVDVVNATMTLVDGKLVPVHDVFSLAGDKNVGLGTQGSVHDSALPLEPQQASSSDSYLKFDDQALDASHDVQNFTSGLHSSTVNSHISKQDDGGSSKGETFERGNENPSIVFPNSDFGESKEFLGINSNPVTESPMQAVESDGNDINEERRNLDEMEPNIQLTFSLIDSVTKFSAPQTSTNTVFSNPESAHSLPDHMTKPSSTLKITFTSTESVILFPQSLLRSKVLKGDQQFVKDKYISEAHDFVPTAGAIANNNSNNSDNTPNLKLSAEHSVRSDVMSADAITAEDMRKSDEWKAKITTEPTKYSMIHTENVLRDVKLKNEYNSSVESTIQPSFTVEFYPSVSKDPTPALQPLIINTSAISNPGSGKIETNIDGESVPSTRPFKTSPLPSVTKYEEYNTSVTMNLFDASEVPHLLELHVNRFEERQRIHPALREQAAVTDTYNRTALFGRLSKISASKKIIHSDTYVNMTKLATRTTAWTFNEVGIPDAPSSTTKNASGGSNVSTITVFKTLVVKDNNFPTTTIGWPDSLKESMASLSAVCRTRTSTTTKTVYETNVRPQDVVLTHTLVRTLFAVSTRTINRFRHTAHSCP